MNSRTTFQRMMILSKLTAPRTLKQNGVAERWNYTLLDMLRSMHSYSSLPLSFWGYALHTVNDILNVVLSKSISSTPLELWDGPKPSLRYFCIWRYPAHILKSRTRKLDLRIEVCMFVDYPKMTSGRLFNSPKNKKIFVSTNVTFLENDYLTKLQTS